MLNLRARRVWLALGAVGIALAFILSLWPHGAPGLETVPDKIQHTVGYALVVLWFVGLVHSRWYWRVFLAAVLLGGLIEILQSFTDTRTVSPMPCCNSTPMAALDATMPFEPMPASVSPRCSA